MFSHTESLHAPHLLDIEAIQVLRRPVREGVVSMPRADQAITDQLDLRINRYHQFLLLPRIWQLRHNFWAYDAAYVALPEEVGAILLIRDRGLASAFGHEARIQVL